MLEDLIKHSISVANLCRNFSQYLGNSGDFTHTLYQAGCYHDIGKIMLHQGTLLKKGYLTHEEWNHIKKHVIYSRIVISKYKLDPEVIKIVEQHHEEDSGNGYPKRLDESSIHEGAKILKICDTYISLRESRPYRNEFTTEKALEIMDEMSNKKQINPKLYKTFKYMILDIDVLKRASND